MLPPSSDTWVVAEIGQNHNGDAYCATRLVSDAVRAGANAVKFQLRDCEREYPQDVLNAPHSLPHHAFGRTYREHRKHLDLTLDELCMIRQRIEYNRWPVTMFVTPCHAALVDDLERRLDPPIYKVASKDICNEDLLQAVSETGKPVILSTGLARTSDICNATEYFTDVAVLHCTSLYPCPLERVDLATIRDLSSAFPVVGFSDHTGCTACAAPAVALGAKIIEAHITFSKWAKGRDHAASLDPEQFRHYVDIIRRTEELMGTVRTELPHEVVQSDKYRGLHR